MGMACVLAASFVAGPAAADTMAGFTAMGSIYYTHTSVTGGTDSNLAGGGVSIGMPVDEISGLNWQLDGNYNHIWGSCTGGCSAELWNLGFSPFWAGQSGRAGINVNYETQTHLGHLTNGGLFTEWYFGKLTAAAKGGWLSTGGSAVGGHGNYVGGAVTFYALPNLSITGAADWNDLVTGHGCSTCGRTDLHNWYLSAIVEFLVSEQFPISIYGGYSYGHHTDSFFHDSSNTHTFLIGAHYYLGRGMPLIDQHRNGNLFPWLRGSSFFGPL
jgi:hypothetical protein